jgi:hypothetical protein
MNTSEWGSKAPCIINLALNWSTTPHMLWSTCPMKTSFVPIWQNVSCSWSQYRHGTEKENPCPCRKWNPSAWLRAFSAPRLGWNGLIKNYSWLLSTLGLSMRVYSSMLPESLLLVYKHKCYSHKYSATSIIQTKQSTAVFRLQNYLDYWISIKKF